MSTFTQCWQLKTLNKRFFAAIRNEVVYLKNKSITFFTLNNAELIVCNNMRSVNGLKRLILLKTNYFTLQMVWIHLCLNQI